MENKQESLTDRNFWLRYWENKNNLIQPVDYRNSFSELFAEIIEQEKPKSAIELGGFPGTFSIYLKKKYDLDISLFDFIIHEGILKQLLEVNQLKTSDLETIEGDVFQYAPAKQWDLVFSVGLIEHFKDTEAIVHQHLPYLKPGGTLLLTIPNFRGINGWIQKNFDPENFNKHYLHLMDPEYLRKLLEAQGMEVKRSEHYGKFTSWLEARKEKALWKRAIERVIWFNGKIFTTIFPVKNRLLSPYIIVIAKKKA